MLIFRDRGRKDESTDTTETGPVAVTGVIRSRSWRIHESGRGVAEYVILL
jgi:hypothetical protein